jgi:hypothetical protein
MDLILSDTLSMDSTVMGSDKPVWRKIREIPELMSYLHESQDRLPMSDIDLNALDLEDSKTPLFFHIPLSRLIISTIVSWGIYDLYWLYKNWHFLRFVRQDRGLSSNFWWDVINPFRIVHIFVKIGMDKELNRAVPNRGYFETNGILWLLTWPLTHFLALIRVQNYVNECNFKLGRRYTPKSFGHYLALVVGGTGWLSLLYGLIFF